MKNEKMIEYPVCKKQTPAENNFCTNCRYPINIRKINEFSK